MMHVRSIKNTAKVTFNTALSLLRSIECCQFSWRSRAFITMQD